MAQWLTNPTRNHEVVGSVPALAQWVKGSGVAVSCGVSCRRGSDRIVAVAQVRFLALEILHAKGMGKKKRKGKKENKKDKRNMEFPSWLSG